MSDLLTVAFTGTRKGMTPNQRTNIVTYLSSQKGRIKAGIHGDAIGADAEFDAICRELGIPTKCFPSDRPDQRAFTQAEVLADPMHPLERNIKIVEAASMLLACPATKEPTRSGTWHTIGQARLRAVPMIVCSP